MLKFSVKYSYLPLLLTLLLTPWTSMSAKFPNAVSKKFVFEGKKAQEIASLLGINLESSFEAKLRLHSNNEWAVYLRDTPNPDPSSHAVERPRYNTIRYSPNPPQITLEGDWLDTLTGSSPLKPRYTFGSPFISETGEDFKEWRAILKKNISSPGTKEVKVLSEKKIGDGSSSDFKLTIYQARDYYKNPEGEWGYQLQIGAE